MHYGIPGIATRNCYAYVRFPPYKTEKKNMQSKLKGCLF